jgi:pimeloyl-ACP methyl ester carboxylesterase
VRWWSRSGAALGILAAGCAAARVKPTEGVEFPRAPLEPEIAALPGAAAYWMPDLVYGGGLYVIQAGTDAAGRPPLILVHGLGEAGVRDFYPVFASLARERRIVAFDLPGFGRSGRANVRYDPEGYARVLSRVIEAQAKGGRVDVLGHSLGGAVALLAAAMFPQQVRRLVVVDAAGILHREAFVGRQVYDATELASAFLPALTELVRGAADVVLGEARKYEPPAELILDSELLRKTFLGADPGRIAALGLILHDFGAALTGLQAPTLIVWGRNDHTASLRTGRLLVDRIRHARLAVLDNVGHVPMQDAPAELVALVEHHLDDPDPTPNNLRASSAFPSPSGQSQGEVRCADQSDVHFSGVYDRIVLDHCARAVLDEVRVGQLVAVASSVEIWGSIIDGGIVADQTQLVMTAGRVGGAIALDLDGSRLDLAGVAIEGSQPVRIRGPSRMLFSVCPIRTQSGLMHAHGVQRLVAGEALRVPTRRD